MAESPFRKVPKGKFMTEHLALKSNRGRGVNMGVAGLSPKLESAFLYLKSEDNICKALVKLLCN